MSQATEPREAEGVAEARAQRKLTTSVGTTLAPRSKPSWKERLRIRKAKT
jgi:hypothetical protein